MTDAALKRDIKRYQRFMQLEREFEGEFGDKLHPGLDIDQPTRNRVARSLEELALAAARLRLLPHREYCRPILWKWADQMSLTTGITPTIPQITGADRPSDIRELGSLTKYLEVGGSLEVALRIVADLLPAHVDRVSKASYETRQTRDVLLDAVLLLDKELMREQLTIAEYEDRLRDDGYSLDSGDHKM